MTDCYCDYDPAEFYRCTTPRARKIYKCEECGGPIKLGEQYERVTGKWEEYIYTFLTCERCVDLRIWVKNNVPCLCWAHGNADASLREAVDDAYDRAHNEVVGLKFGLLRRFVLRDRHNKAARTQS